MKFKFFLILSTLCVSLQNYGFAQIERPLTLDEKIGQLFVIPVCQLREDDHFADLQRIILEGKAGGILLMQGTAQGQRGLIAKLQEIAPRPLLCVQDGECGVAMRLTDALSFPMNLTLGAVQDLSLLYELGQEMGRQCRLVGTHVNLAPVVDVNSNPLNPIIHMRSFGEDPLQVALRGEMVMKGMQSEGIFTCAKHFPGHGDTSVDSHLDLPEVNHGLERLQAVEFFPFDSLIQSGVKMVMSGHLHVKALAEEENLPATFSKRIVTDLLQKQMGFKGLVITDALNMGAITSSVGETVVKAFLAGHDLFLYGSRWAADVDEILRISIPEAFTAIKTAVESNEITEEMIDQRVSKILEAKRELGLFEKRCSDAEEQINSPSTYALQKRLFQEAMTMVRNEGMLPIKEEKMVLIEWGEAPWFKSVLEEELALETISLSDPELFAKLQGYSSAILALSKLTWVQPHFGMGSEEKAILSALAETQKPIAAVVFGTPYSLAQLPQFTSIVVAYEDLKEAQEAAAELVLGRIIAKGKLPVSNPQEER